MNEATRERRPSVHFSGIGGIAMAGGARLAVEAGWEVRGSDNPLYPPASDMAASLGVPVAESYAAENLDWNPDRVVIGNVLSRGNPEVEAALDRRLHILSLAEWLKDYVLRARRPVAVCGTHGKTTTTTMTAFLLDAVGLAPGWLIGGQPVGLPHSARLGEKGRPFVIEGDEYDTSLFDKRAKFFHYLPEAAVVTSIEFDHGDIYPDIEAVHRAFQLMLRQIPQGGWLILCADDPGTASLADHAFSRVLSYGFSAAARFRSSEPVLENGFQRLAVSLDDQLWGTARLPMAGRHNACNALAALAVGHVLGASPADLCGALASFGGVKRRIEVFLEAKGAVFVDDFAHHPTAIAATIAAARSRWPRRRIRALLEPRSNTLVTREFDDAVFEALRNASEVHLGPIYRAERIPAGRQLQRAAIAKRLGAAGVAASVADDFEELAQHIWETLEEDDLVLCMSNGAFGGIYRRFRELAGERT